MSCQIKSGCNVVACMFLNAQEPSWFFEGKSSWPNLDATFQHCDRTIVSPIVQYEVIHHEVVPDAYEKVVCCALRHNISCTAAYYKLSVSTVESLCDFADQDSHQLPKRINSFLAGIVKGWKEPSASVRTVLKEIGEILSIHGFCHLTANAIYATISRQRSKGATDVCGNYIAQIDSSNLCWERHVFNVFVVDDEETTLVWYAVDRDTNSIIFCAPSKSHLRSQLKAFYCDQPGAILTTQPNMTLFPGFIESWKDTLPDWKSEDGEELLEMPEAEIQAIQHQNRIKEVQRAAPILWNLSEDLSDWGSNDDWERL